MADSYVVDTGVFLRWFVGQDGFEHAQELQQELVDGSITVATIDFALDIGYAEETPFRFVAQVYLWWTSRVGRRATRALWLQ